MECLINPLRAEGLPEADLSHVPDVARDPAPVLELLRHCPLASATPLLDVPALADRFGVASLHIKDERTRMGLGSFKALGAAFVIAREAARRAGGADRLAGHPSPDRILDGTTYVCASAGNHGLSLTAGARVFGARAVVFVSETVSGDFVDRLEARGAEVVRSGSIYEESMAAAREAARQNGWVHLSDSSWPGYTELPHGVMEGYLAMADEAAAELEAAHGPPSHILLQAGVGGLAASVAGYARNRWGDAPRIVVVEPDAAPALMASVRARGVVNTGGPVSIMGRLDCKEPSLIALHALARDADAFVTVSDDQARATVALLREQGIETTPSGAAGLAALHHAGEQRRTLGLSADSRVLAFLTEGPEHQRNGAAA